MRKISEVIVHCTATPEGRAVSVAEIRKWHKDRGWSDIGYHRVVHLGGGVEQGRPDAIVGSHVAGHNTGTIGIVYVGGVDKNMKAKDTRTPEQKRALEALIRELLAKYPGIKMISGHHDYAAKACPCFPARAEYAHLLKGGTSLPSPAPSNEAPASGSGIVTASSLRLRRTPDGEIIGSMPKGTPVLIYGSDGEWLNIETPFGARGWAGRAFIAPDGVDEPVPSASAAPDMADLLRRITEVETETAAIRAALEA